MGEPLAEFTQAQLDYLSNYMRQHANEWISEPALERYEKQRDRELEQQKQIIRLEESQKSLLEQMKLGFEQMEKRFEQVDKRFEQVDKRFEQVDKRFDEVNKNLGRLMTYFTTAFVIFGILLTLPIFR